MKKQQQQQKNKPETPPPPNCGLSNKLTTIYKTNTGKKIQDQDFFDEAQKPNQQSFTS